VSIISKNRTKEELLIKHGIAISQGITESKHKYRKIIQAGIAKWVSDFQKGNIEIKSVDDLKKLIELDIELQRDDL
jgi:trehalose/maltose hydrolase-like predicted phosphorylase